jgi:AcrR family transcriptional regulator
MAPALVAAGVDGRPLPRAAYLAGLAGVEGPPRRIFMDQGEQRRRFLEAMGALVLERGFPGPNVQHVSDRAQISRYAFIRHFSDLGDCFNAVLIQAEVDLRDWVRSALDSLSGSYARLAAAVEAVVDFAAQAPVAMRLVAVESFSEAAVCLPGYGEEFATAREWLAMEVGVGALGAPGSVRSDALAATVETLAATRLRGVQGRLGAALAAEVAYFLVAALAGPGGVGGCFGDGEYGLEVGDVVSW